MRISAAKSKTTAARPAAGAKTVRVHEGSHVLEFLKIIVAANARRPYPAPLVAPNGTPANTFKAMLGAFVTARQAFFDDLAAAKAASILAVDCAGIPIDEYNRQHDIKEKKVCP